MKEINEILRNIDRFEPQDDNWIELDKLLEEFWEIEDSRNGISTLFRVFERFAEDDGCEVFWTILHGLEYLGNYENELINSLKRQPSHFGVIMLHRIKNSGQDEINNENIEKLFHSLLSHNKIPKSVEEDINGFLEYYRK